MKQNNNNNKRQTGNRNNRTNKLLANVYTVMQSKPQDYIQSLRIQVIAFIVPPNISEIELNNQKVQGIKQRIHAKESNKRITAGWSHCLLQLSFRSGVFPQIAP